MKLKSIMTRLYNIVPRLTGYDLFMLKMEMEDEGFIPHGINIGKTVLSLEDECKLHLGVSSTRHKRATWSKVYI